MVRPPVRLGAISISTANGISSFYPSAQTANKEGLLVRVEVSAKRQRNVLLLDFAFFAIYFGALVYLLPIVSSAVPKATVVEPWILASSYWHPWLISFLIFDGRTPAMLVYRIWVEKNGRAGRRLTHFIRALTFPICYWINLQAAFWRCKHEGSGPYDVLFRYRMFEHSDAV